MHFTHVYKVQRYLVFTSCYLFGLVLYFHVPCSMFHVPRSMFHVPRSIHSPSLSELLACYSLFLERLFCTATGQFSPWRRSSSLNLVAPRYSRFRAQLVIYSRLPISNGTQARKRNCSQCRSRARLFFTVFQWLTARAVKVASRLIQLSASVRC